MLENGNRGSSICTSLTWDICIIYSVTSEMTFYIHLIVLSEIGDRNYIKV